METLATGMVALLPILKLFILFIFSNRREREAFLSVQNGFTAKSGLYSLVEATSPFWGLLLGTPPKLLWLCARSIFNKGGSERDPISYGHVQEDPQQSRS